MEELLGSDLKTVTTVTTVTRGDISRGQTELRTVNMSFLYYYQLFLLLFIRSAVETFDSSAKLQESAGGSNMNEIFKSCFVNLYDRTTGRTSEPEHRPVDLGVLVVTF